MNKKLIIISRAIVTRNGKILLVRKKGANFWHYPGGKWEAEIETLKECAVREVKEETGLRIKTIGVAFFMEKRNDGKIYLEFLWKARLLGSEKIKISENGIEACWMKKNEIKKNTVLPKEINPYE